MVTWQAGERRERDRGERPGGERAAVCCRWAERPAGGVAVHDVRQRPLTELSGEVIRGTARTTGDR